MQRLKLFISHRMEDQEVAKVISKSFQGWGVLPKNIFSFSTPGLGVTPGSQLFDEIMNAIHSCNLFILVHTYAERDWNKCMIEYGMAVAHGVEKVKVIVLQCTDDDPVIFEGPMKVVVDRNGIKDMLLSLHKVPGFIPNISDNDGDDDIALSPETDDAIISERSQGLAAGLKEILPDGVKSSNHLWDFIRIVISPEHSVQITKVLSGADENKKEQCIDLIKKYAEIHRPIYSGLDNSVDASVRQFGFASYTDSLKLLDLVQRWQERQKENDRETSTTWADDLYEGIYRALYNMPSAKIGEKFCTARVDANWWFVPIITRIRRSPDHRIDFDIYLVRVDS